jgi:FGGY-family pentulose kinase
MSEKLYLGIDVGTGSVRAGIFDSEGNRRAAATHEIQVWRPQEDFVEQSSEDIWTAVGKTVRGAMEEAGCSAEAVRGIGFDATCSMVVLDGEDRPVTVSPAGSDEQNIIVWMDHRAMDQTARINATKHKVLDYVGGQVSPEMQTPKLLWLKENLLATWKRAAHFLDLPDYLSYRATEDPHIEGSVGGWEDSYFKTVGLDDLAEEGYKRIGRRVRPMGEPVGQGLTAKAAEELGLRPGTPVAVSIIDAHAGGLGLLGAPLDGKAPEASDFDRRLALICGTSTCHMAVSPEARFIPGVWGPYFSAMVPDLWLTEGGQSATGALIDHVIFSHARGAELDQEAKSRGITAYALLNERLERMAKDQPFPAALTRELHVLPYFHGNRSPRADASLRGSIHGLKLDAGVDNLALIYLATIQALAAGTRHIVEALNEKGYAIDTLIACGGDTKNEVFLREHADATSCRIVLPSEPEAVILGSALLGAVAAGDFPTVVTGMGAMNRAGRIIEPAGDAVRRYHDAKYAIFHRMYDDHMAYRTLIDGAHS